MSLAARLLKLREKSGESLQQVADAVGVSKAHIWELEMGRTNNPSMSLLTALADHFKTSVAALVGEDLKASDADRALARMFRQARDLDPADLKFLEEMMEALRKRHGQRVRQESE